MGDPKKARKTYSRPRSPWRADQLAQELYLLGTFGLRNKRELWKAETHLSSVRKQARTLLAATEQVRLREERKLLASLYRRGLVEENAALDDILNLTVEDVLARRLQTMVFKKGMALSAPHARQLIVHGHVMVGGRTITIPGYGVSRDEEGTVKLTGVKAQVPPAQPAPMEEPTALAEAEGQKEEKPQEVEAAAPE
ncbi:MAG: 30S ribosomal protein S4 [Nitrososphaerales archaeon]|nr:30S ribosomal protein S4 [Nitrososphaerales archaeon]